MNIPIKDTHSNILKFLINQDDAKKYSHGSNKYIDCKCPNCGFEKRVMVGNLCRKGFYCPICADGISYPEKFIMMLLRSQGIKFKHQLTNKDFNWCEKYRYDFYLSDYNYIIEVHGSQHYDTPFKFNGVEDVTQTIENDKFKKYLAIQNGIKEEGYIVIDCRNSDIEWIVQSIMNTNLTNLIDLSNINWQAIDIQSHNSLVQEICDFYDNNKPIETPEIAEKFQISRDTVVRYLKIGHKHNICSYDSKQARINAGIKGNVITQKNLSHPVDVYKDGVFIKSYESAKELYRQSIQDYDIQFCYSSICEVCRGITKSHHGYVFKYQNMENENVKN